MKSAKPSRIMTRPADDVCYCSQMYATPIQRINSAGMRAGESCIPRLVRMFFVGRADPFNCGELHLNKIWATCFFAEKLQRTIDNSMGSISYFN